MGVGELRSTQPLGIQADRGSTILQPDLPDLCGHWHPAGVRESAWRSAMGQAFIGYD